MDVKVRCLSLLFYTLLNKYVVYSCSKQRISVVALYALCLWQRFCVCVYTCIICSNVCMYMCVQNRVFMVYKQNENKNLHLRK